MQTCTMNKKPVEAIMMNGGHDEHDATPSVTSALKESRIINTYVITDTGYINHTIRKYNISRDSDT